jgi:hypothetical protein
VLRSGIIDFGRVKIEMGGRVVEIVHSVLAILGGSEVLGMGSPDSEFHCRGEERKSKHPALAASQSRAARYVEGKKFRSRAAVTSSD